MNEQPIPHSAVAGTTASRPKGPAITLIEFAGRAWPRIRQRLGRRPAAHRLYALACVLSVPVVLSTVATGSVRGTPSSIFALRALAVAFLVAGGIGLVHEMTVYARERTHLFQKPLVRWLLAVAAGLVSIIAAIDTRTMIYEATGMNPNSFLQTTGIIWPVVTLFYWTVIVALVGTLVALCSAMLFAVRCMIDDWQKGWLFSTLRTTRLIRWLCGPWRPRRMNVDLLVVGGRGIGLAACCACGLIWIEQMPRTRLLLRATVPTVIAHSDCRTAVGLSGIQSGERVGFLSDSDLVIATPEGSSFRFRQSPRTLHLPQ